METNKKNSNLLELSIKNDTKDKFDALLKAAINKKSISNENLLESNDDVSQNDENYILNKFLNNNSKESEEFISVDLQNDNITYIKPPVAKPRRKLVRTDSQSSQRTYEVTSPKVLNSPKNKQKEVKSPDSSNRTYTLEKTGKEIGDVLIHNSTKAIVVISQNNSPVLEKGDVESLSDDETKFPFDVIRGDEKGESIELEEMKDSVEYVNEIKPKPRLRMKKTEKKEQVKEYCYDRILEIIVHKTDKLELTSFVVHPVVKIHIVAMDTGNYLKKSDKDRSVVFFYENKNYDYISPIITYNYNLQERRSLFPCWEENIILNEDYSYIKENIENTIVFFEILDFVSFSVVAANVPQIQKGWYKIAFAFLKLGSKTFHNLEKKLRLQLYYPQVLKSGPEGEKCQLWDWWKKNKKLRKYPSTLYVTVKSMIPPGKIIDVLRSKTPVEREGSRMQLRSELHFNDGQKLMSGDNKDLPTLSERREEFSWAKAPYETCKLPNKLLVKFENFEEGCIVFKFSNNGLFLACAVKTDDMYSIIVYSIKSLREVNIFPCHQGLVYSIRWSRDDSLLVSASSDNTVSVWNFSNSVFLQILPHASFVYCAEFSSSNEIASGSYDKILRIWKKIDEKYALEQELKGHKGFVTSMCFNKKSTQLLSADSNGLIIEWKKTSEEKWERNRELILMEIRETIINQILLFPKEKRILIHSRDSTLRIVDLKTSCILHWLKGALNRKIQTFCSVSSCGTFVVSGSENGSVNVWNTRNGHCCAIYEPFPNCAINCVEFHPFDNILALSHYGDYLPVILYNYDRNTNDNRINLRIMEDNEGKVTKEEISSSATNRWKRDELETSSDVNITCKSVLKKMDDVIEAEMKRNQVAEN